MAVNQFLEQAKLTQVQNKYLEVFNAVDNLATTYLTLSGGALTGDVTTTNTTFSNTSLVTKNYVTENTISEVIFDVETLPTGANIKDVVYRATVAASTAVTADLDLPALLESMGFTVNEHSEGGGSGYTYYDCTPPAGITYTATVNDTDYTITTIQVTASNEHGLFATCSINNSISVQENEEFTISYPTIHYYLGNSTAGTTTELIIGSGSSGDYMPLVGTTLANTNFNLLSTYDDGYYNAGIELNSTDGKGVVLSSSYDSDTNFVYLTIGADQNTSMLGAKLYTSDGTDLLDTSLTLGDDASGLYFNATDTIDGLASGTNLYLVSSDYFLIANSSSLVINDITNETVLFSVDNTQLKYYGSNGIDIAYDDYGAYKFAITNTSSITTAELGVSDYDVGIALVSIKMESFQDTTITSGNDIGLKLTGKYTSGGTVVDPTLPIYFGSKIKSSQNSVASFTDDNEFVTKLYVDNHTPDLSGYVSVVDYNDLVFRLNDFLLETSNVEPATNTFALTASTSEITVSFNQSAAGALTIDWGDGAVSTSGDTTGNTTLTHTYAEANVYYLTFTKASDTTVTVSGISGTGASVTQANIVDITVSEFSTALTKAYIDTNITATMVDNNASMTKITLGSDVASIAALSFAGCTSLATIKVKNGSANITTLAGNLFANGTETLPVGFKIYVPNAKLAEYKAASGWSTYATYIVGE